MNAILELFDMVGELARRRYQAGARAFSAVGLNHTEARLLTLLKKEGEKAPQDALSNLLHVDRTNSGRALQRLEQAGYITRRKDGKDKRANLVQMTAKGRKAIVEIAKLRKRIAESFFGDLEEHEAAAIMSLLTKTTPQKREAEQKLSAWG